MINFGVTNHTINLTSEVNWGYQIQRRELVNPFIFFVSLRIFFLITILFFSPDFDYPKLSSEFLDKPKPSGSFWFLSMLLLNFYFRLLRNRII